MDTLDRNRLTGPNGIRAHRKYAFSTCSLSNLPPIGCIAHRRAFKLRRTTRRLRGECEVISAEFGPVDSQILVLRVSTAEFIQTARRSACAWMVSHACMHTDRQTDRHYIGDVPSGLGLKLRGLRAHILRVRQRKETQNRQLRCAATNVLCTQTCPLQRSGRRAEGVRRMSLPDA